MAISDSHNLWASSCLYTAQPTRIHTTGAIHSPVANSQQQRDPHGWVTPRILRLFLGYPSEPHRSRGLMVPDMGIEHELNNLLKRKMSTTVAPVNFPLPMEYWNNGMYADSDCCPILTHPVPGTGVHCQCYLISATLAIEKMRSKQLHLQERNSTEWSICLSRNCDHDEFGPPTNVLFVVNVQ